MRELLLLRHAKATKASPDGRDIERPLSNRGEQQAHAVGDWMRKHEAIPDAVLCSPARRTQMTAEAIGRILPMPAPQFLPDVYDATPGDLLSLIESQADRAARVLLIGHNPALEQLLALLTQGRSSDARGMSPASLAWLEWKGDLPEPGRCRLRAFWSP
jgi:phosphohistidine phosphatase